MNRKISKLLSCCAVLLATAPSLAGGYASSRFLKTHAEAWAEAWGAYDTDSETHTGSMSDAYAYKSGWKTFSNGSFYQWGECYAWAKTYGRVGGWADSDGGGDAGPLPHFLDEVRDPNAADGFAFLEVNPRFEDGEVVLSIRYANNENGFLEVSVVDISAMAEGEAEALLDSNRSVELALASGDLEAERVVGRWRERDLAALESAAAPLDVAGLERAGDARTGELRVSLGGRAASDVMIVGVFHALAANEDAQSADLNADGRVDATDYADFTSAWASGEASADLDGSGSLDIRDHLRFLDLFAGR